MHAAPYPLPALPTCYTLKNPHWFSNYAHFHAHQTSEAALKWNPHAVQTWWQILLSSEGSFNRELPWCSHNTKWELAQPCDFIYSMLEFFPPPNDPGSSPFCQSGPPATSQHLSPFIDLLFILTVSTVHLPDRRSHWRVSIDDVIVWHPEKPAR